MQKSLWTSKTGDSCDLNGMCLIVFESRNKIAICLVIPQNKTSLHPPVLMFNPWHA